MHINKYAPTIELLVRKSFQIKRYTMMYVSLFQNIFLSTEKQAYQSVGFVQCTVPFAQISCNGFVHVNQTKFVNLKYKLP